MHNRVVSLASLALVIISVAFFLLGAWSVFSGQMSVGDGVFLAGWLLTAIVFSYRFADPAYLEPISIVKR
ncbi:MAG: hypothetical protein LAP87_13115 [Acidobacteriia bacterium]|nr:hypothetical protein [Terriglobia bacterium]